MYQSWITRSSKIANYIIRHRRYLSDQLFDARRRILVWVEAFIVWHHVTQTKNDHWIRLTPRCADAFDPPKKRFLLVRNAKDVHLPKCARNSGRQMRRYSFVEFMFCVVASCRQWYTKTGTPSPFRSSSSRRSVHGGNCFYQRLIFCFILWFRIAVIHIWLMCFKFFASAHLLLLLSFLHLGQRWNRETTQHKSCPQNIKPGEFLRKYDEG